MSTLNLQGEKLMFRYYPSWSTNFSTMYGLSSTPVTFHTLFRSCNRSKWTKSVNLLLFTSGYERQLPILDLFLWRSKHWFLAGIRCSNPLIGHGANCTNNLGVPIQQHSQHTLRWIPRSIDMRVPCRSFPEDESLSLSLLIRNTTISSSESYVRSMRQSKIQVQKPI